MPKRESTKINNPMSNFNAIIAQLPLLFKKLENMEFLSRGDARKLPKKGVYVFYEDSKPMYIGRSRRLPKRMLIHGRCCSKHNAASFAFLLAKEKAQKRGLEIAMSRKKLQRDSQFSKIYINEKKRVARMKIKAVSIENPETQAIFEIYASKELCTKYNDFNTH